VNAGEHTRQDVAARLGISYERVRQIEKKAMQRLRTRHRRIGRPEQAA
jgi:DNA-directed RNA polymerase sigma subunit (sigma70/sigma32)